MTSKVQMLFKTQAQKLMEEMDKASARPFRTPEDIQSYFKRKTELDEKTAEWGAKHPEEFIALLSDENAMSVGKWICGSGELGIGLLRALIQEIGAAQRKAALRALWEFDERGTSEIPMLMGLLEDADPAIRGSAAQCLGRIGPDAACAGARLAELAQYGSDDERPSAFFALEKTGYDPLITTQICYDAIQSGSESTRRVALSTLKSIGADPRPVIHSILEHLEGKNGRTIESASLDLIKKCDLNDETLRHRVVQVLEACILKNPPHRADGLSKLWEIDPGNKLVLLEVEKDLKSNDGEMESACDVICQMQGEGARFVPLMMEQLEKHWDYWDFCWAAVDALGEIGLPAKASIPMLKRLESHPSGLVKERAKLALEKITNSKGN